MDDFGWNEHDDDNPLKMNKMNSDFTLLAS